MSHLITRRRISALFGLFALIIISLSHPLSAQSVTQGYTFDGVAQRGMVVSLKQDDASKIELSTLDNATQAHGVIVDPNDSPVTISSENQKVFVATVGRYDVLVSDQNGPIAPGDYLTLSAVEGIAMKADENQYVSVGKALTAFDGKTTVVSTVDLKDSSGGVQKVSIGRVQLDIGIGSNPLARPKQSNLPEYLQKMADGIADKPVNSIRIYLGLILLAVSGTIAGSLIYGGVRSSLISIGRNPLSKKSIIRGLIQVIITSIMILVVGIFGVYLLIKL
ncbi:hypothetical protein IPO96_03580 [Candidatus Saccharibacteria bacterium]|nr:MAG: hypothetical protein IPO96_03580 [Candidatus Saccharibacteria bacterium]